VKDVHRLLEPNGVYRSIRVSVVRLNDLQEARTESFPGFAVGAVPPNCAMPRAFPMSSLTAAGKARKSRLEDPTQCSCGYRILDRTPWTPGEAGPRPCQRSAKATRVTRRRECRQRQPRSVVVPLPSWCGVMGTRIVGQAMRQRDRTDGAAR
jgi:hypothetical protein